MIVSDSVINSLCEDVETLQTLVKQQQEQIQVQASRLHELELIQFHIQARRRIELIKKDEKS